MITLFLLPEGLNIQTMHPIILYLLASGTNPYFLQIPGDTDVGPGGSIYFSCKAGGDPPPRIFWRKGGVALELDGQSSGQRNVGRNIRDRRLADGSSRLHVFQVRIMEKAMVKTLIRVNIYI